jgi:serine protease AprX
VAQPRGNVEPALETYLTQHDVSASSSERIELAVTFVDTLQHPRFPHFNELEPRNSVGNKRALSDTANLVADIEAARRPEYEARQADYLAKFDARMTGTFWLINGATIDVPLRNVRSLAQSVGVQYVEQNRPHTAPPLSHNMWDARFLISSDSYRFLSAGWIAMLDTGVRSTHALLTDRLDYVRDCVHGTSSWCFTGTGLDPTDQCNAVSPGHGTAVAGALSGNGSLGDTSRGVTDILIDSFKVYDVCGIVRGAAVRGFEAGFGVGDRVILANIQDVDTDVGMISTAADNAFDHGSVVVAAAGNFGPAASSITAPGNAHKALAVGEVEVADSSLIGASGRGPAPDGRVKPDVLGPSDLIVPANTSDTSFFQGSGTSLSTPVVTGFVSLMRLKLVSNFPSADSPGAVNALTILLGQNFSLPYNDNNKGAGIVRTFDPGGYAVGLVSVCSGTNLDIPMPLGTMSSVDVAIWWPESPSLHNDVDLFLKNPSGVQVASSTGSNTIFEKARATTNLAAGTWTIRLTPYSVTGCQSVWWAIYAKS